VDWIGASGQDLTNKAIEVTGPGVFKIRDLPAPQRRRRSRPTLTFYDGRGELLGAIRLGRMPEANKATLKSMLTDELAWVRTQRPDLAVVRLADGANDNWTFLFPQEDEELPTARHRPQSRFSVSLHSALGHHRSRPALLPGEQEIILSVNCRSSEPSDRSSSALT